MHRLQPGDEESAPEYQDQMRTPLEVARRCLVLYAVVAAGHKESREALRRWLHREELWSSVSPDEASLLEAPRPSRQQFVNATWRAEALLPLLWALGAIDSLPTATDICDVQLIRSALPPLLGSTAAFVKKATLRDEAAIWDAHENIYQAHWDVRDAQLNTKPIPNGLDPGVVQERHYALNWLTGYLGQDWDDVTTDT